MSRAGLQTRGRLAGKGAPVKRAPDRRAGELRALLTTQPARAKAGAEDLSAVGLLGLPRDFDCRHAAARTRIPVAGMFCGECVATVERELRGLPGVFAASASLTEGEAGVTHLPHAAIAEASRRAIAQAGFEAGEASIDGRADAAAPPIEAGRGYRSLVRRWWRVGLQELWTGSWNAALVALDVARRAGALDVSELAARRASIAVEREAVESALGALEADDLELVWATAIRPRSARLSSRAVRSQPARAAST